MAVEALTPRAQPEVAVGHVHAPRVSVREQRLIAFQMAAMYLGSAVGAALGGALLTSGSRAADLADGPLEQFWRERTGFGVGGAARDR